MPAANRSATAKKAETLYANLSSLIERVGIERVGFVTLTTPDNCRTELRPTGGWVASRPALYDRSAWSLSAYLNGRSAEQFISILRLPFPGTLELVSISQPCRTLRPLNASITLAGNLDSWNAGRISTVESLYFKSANQCLRRWWRASFVTLTKAPGRPDSVVVKHCRFSRTRLLSQDTWEPTSRLRLVLACLATKDSARFVMRSLNELRSCVGPGSMAGDNCFAGEWNSWASYMDAIPLDSNWPTATSGNGAGVGLLELSANNTKRRSFTLRKSPSGPTCRRVWDFSGRSYTPFKKNMPSTCISSIPRRTVRFECPQCGALLVPEIFDGFAYCGRCSLEIDEHFSN